MSKKYLRIAAMSLAALDLRALGACAGPGPQEPPPPPMASARQPTQAPDLLGGPDPEAAMAPDGQPGEDADADRDDESGFTAMAPIPNPEDMTPDERHHFYGDRYAYLDQEPAAPDEAPYYPLHHHHHGWAHRHHGWTHAHYAWAHRHHRRSCRCRAPAGGYPGRAAHHGAHRGIH